LALYYNGTGVAANILVYLVAGLIVVRQWPIYVLPLKRTVVLVTSVSDVTKLNVHIQVKFLVFIQQ